MKIIITESQYNKILNENELKFRRIYKKIQEYFLRKMEDYIPCNYNYEDGVYDFFADVRGITIERFWMSYMVFNGVTVTMKSF